ncbi:hypothetical protein Nepgr_017940 [Nepenthes gracilis]|uniref:Protein TIFY n=1 Tax=Nepenthes gracilis TaxID=150966 RepID=A0AAD3SSI3_NEPGR|nr:hypothetical protein Nepgr_017940 [Nepenthes gracilis]
MERDFMGLVPKKPLSAIVKQETDDAVDSSSCEPMTQSGVQWSLSNKTANPSQIISISSGQGGSHKLYPPGILKKNLPLDKQAGTVHPLAGYPLPKYDAHLVNHSHGAKITNQMVSVPVSFPALQSHLPSTAQNVPGSRPFGAACMLPSVSCLPVDGAAVGSTDLRNAAKSSNGPSQLTIFYNGLVCVYDDVSSEKAQAIMLLAGNGDSINLNEAAPVPKAQPPVSRSLAVGVSSASIEVYPVKPVAPSNNKPELPRVVGPRGVGRMDFVTPGAPLARKASLARFLDKRKERVMSALPYGGLKNSSECNTSRKDAASFIPNSATLSPLPAIN